jgi:hypothetical protein
MQDRYTYSTQQRVPLIVYVETGYEPPDTITATHDGKQVEFIRLSDASLVCEKVETRINSQGVIVPVPGECGTFDCHRKEPGNCQCGRHPSPVRFVRAEARKEVS